MEKPLHSLLHAALAFGDGLASLGIAGPKTIKLSREDGLKVLALITGCEKPDIEHNPAARVTRIRGCISIEAAGMTFEWPDSQSLGREDARILQAVRLRADL